MVTTTRKVDEFKTMNPAITRNLGEILLLTMNVLVKLHAKARESYMDVDRNSVSRVLRCHRPVS